MSSYRATVLNKRVKKKQFYLVAIFKLAMDSALNHADDQHLS